MFDLTHKLPDECLVAVSGGVDSVAALHWLSRKPGRVAGIVHVDHKSKFSAESFAKTEFLADFYGVPFYHYFISEVFSEDKSLSLEEFWRDARYAFFKEAHEETNLPIVLAHNFDDCLEEYLICTTVRGYMGTIPYAHGPCIRPFRKWKRADIISYARRNSVSWAEDPSNLDDKFLRTRFRYQVVPIIRDINPGVWNIVERAMEVQDRYSGCYEEITRP